MTLSGRKIVLALKWIPAYVWQRLARRHAAEQPMHVVITVANHFEPYILPSRPHEIAPFEVQISRVKKWVQCYEEVFDGARDSCHIPFKHTYFYPGEQYDPEIVGVIAEHCFRGWGELEVHLHHGRGEPDSAEKLRDKLLLFREQLLAHGCLCRLDGVGHPRYAFVHGNFTLANSGHGSCGVDSEILVLAETGCYADFTLPSWPNSAQVRKINSVYECKPPLDRRAAHRQGHDLVVGRRPSLFPLIIQGPLMLDFSKRYWGAVPSVENSAITTLNPPSMGRFKLWKGAAISVKGRPDWVFIKLHCHGMDPRDTPTLLGKPMVNVLTDLCKLERTGSVQRHFVTAREMTNIILAACDGQNGSPNDFRNYRLRLIHPSKSPS